MSSQKIWVEDPFILLDKNHIHELWPKDGTSAEAKLNAGSRIVIILSILGYLVTMNINFFIIGFITLAIIGGLYTVNAASSSIGDESLSTNKDGKEGFIQSSKSIDV